MCIDWELNKVMVKNKDLIPLIVDFFDRLGRVRYFTKLDLRSGYYQVRIGKGGEQKTMCMMRYGSYELCSTPFRSDPIGVSEPDPGCSFNYFFIYFSFIYLFFCKSVETQIPGST